MGWKTPNFILRGGISLVIVDDVPPEVSLKGDAELELFVGDEYEEAGATARDNYDGDLSDKVVVKGEVDTKKAGEYEVRYTAKDSSGNERSVTRKVTVSERPKPVVAQSTVAQSATKTATANTISGEEITRYLDSKGDKVGVGYYNLVTGKSYFYHQNEVIYGASLIKTLAVTYLYDKGLVKPELLADINLAISVSDDAAYKRLVNRIGRDNMIAYGNSLGVATLSGTTNQYFENTTVMGQLAYLKQLWNVSVKHPEMRAPFLNSNHNYLRVGAAAVMHKYGEYQIWRHDVGIVLDSQPYIVIVLTEHGANGPGIIREIAGLIDRLHKS